MPKTDVILNTCNALLRKERKKVRGTLHIISHDKQWLLLQYNKLYLSQYDFIRIQLGNSYKELNECFTMKSKGLNALHVMLQFTKA